MTPHPVLRDLFGRALQNLRLSVTDRCNLRCHYCMPEREYEWLPKADRLSFEELAQLVQAMQPLGVQKVRLTGGEPLLRKELHHLVESLRQLSGLQEIALTTNALLLDAQAQDLKAAGLDRITVSLDTLRPDRFEAMTGRPRLPEVWQGLAAADAAGFEGTKINAVICRGRNDDELEALVEFAIEKGYEMRFIEYMDVGGALDWSATQVVPKQEMLSRLSQRFGKITSVETEASAPARRFELENGNRFGIIASTTEPFCADCTRSRITADGLLFTCLYGTQGLDLRQRLRAGASLEEITRAVTEVWAQRSDRGAELRLADPKRGSSFSKESLQANPHLEMHTKGG